VVTGTGVAGALTGCGGSGNTDGSAAPATPPASTAPPTAAPSQAPPAAGTPLAQTGDIAVGGGKVFVAQKVVVTQPNAGEFKAFTAVCTHMGCLVNKVAGETITCPCHGSTYSAADGAVTGGPATRGLAPTAIDVSGTTISLR